MKHPNIPKMTKKVWFTLWIIWKTKKPTQKMLSERFSESDASKFIKELVKLGMITTEKSYNKNLKLTINGRFYGRLYNSLLKVENNKDDWI